MANKTIVFVISTILALSGWSTLLYNWSTSEPKIDGQVLTIITADWHNPQFGDKPKTLIMPYLYLINKRKNPVHILDYELEFDTGAGFEKALRVYGIDDKFRSNIGDAKNDVVIPNFVEKLIYSKHLPVEYGTPLHGFAVFVSDRPASEISGKIKKIKITCVDAFNNKHVITSSREQLFNTYLLQDLAGIEIKQKNIPQINSKQ